jgi:hypothetical protein
MEVESGAGGNEKTFEYFEGVGPCKRTYKIVFQKNLKVQEKIAIPKNTTLSFLWL